MKFKLEVRKMKCSYCDLIFLVEENNNTPQPHMLSCPSCRGEEVDSVGDMGVIMIEEVDYE